jgi:membrane-associated protease RseP (regulator of RpoE activity)
MSEEPNTEPVEPATGPPPLEPPADAANAPSPPARSGVFVPKWVLLSICGLLLLGFAFAAGLVVGSHGDHGERRGAFSFNVDGRRPFGGNNSPVAPTPRNGNRRNGGGSGTTPSSAVYLGVAVQDSSNPAGAALARVATSSPAAGAGLQAGDVVTALDSTAITSAAQLTASVRSHHAGDEVSVTYSRGGASNTVKVRLATRPTVPQPPQLPQQ